MKKAISLFLIVAMLIPLVNLPIVASAKYLPTITVDMSEKTGEMRHGSGGFLYGLGSVGTPSVNTLTPLKPSTAVQKAPDGLQHPTGDVLDVAGTFISAGGEQVQIYLQDIYALWPYEQTSFDEYLSHIEEMVPKIVALRNSSPEFSGKLVYVPFNEPDGIWYGNIGWDASVQARFNQNWLSAYTLIKKLDPDALIAGTSCANYQSGHMDSWLSFCTQNNCEPDYITWHELQDYDLNSFAANLANYRSIERKYSMTEREIIINEYAPQDHCSNPGKLVNWIALFEENKVSGCLPYWHNAGNLNDLAADNNEPNGAWWLYKWYGDMSGETLSLTTNTARTEFYALASIDDNKKTSSVILGGTDGDGQVVLKNINDTTPFAESEFVDIEVKATYWTAFHGVAEEPRCVIKGTYKVTDNSVTVTIPSMEANGAYLVTVSPSENTEETIYYGSERKLYEIENGALVGSVYPNNTRWTYAYSGGYRLSGVQSASDGANVYVSVDHTGFYRMDLTYANGYGTNSADPSANDPKSLFASISFDSSDSQIITLENTLRDEMAGMYSEYVYLTSGEHTLKIRGVDTNGGSFSLDSVAFTYIGGTVGEFDSVFEAEKGDFNTLSANSSTHLTTESELFGYSGSGYITGLDAVSVPNGGGVRFTVVVPDNSLYTIALRYFSESDSSANIYLDNTSLDLDNLLTTVSLPKSETFSTEFATVFLQKGINIIDLDTSSPVALDYMRVKKADGEPIVCEAEDGTLSGNASLCENEFASNSIFVSNIEGATDDKLTFSVTAPTSGEYKMVITHSSGELFGGHTYNAQLVDRYASFSVNSASPERLYFKNTYSTSNWRTTVLNVNLTEGENTVTVFNDNYRIVANGTGSTGNITYNTLKNLAPNFDKFEFYPAVAKNTNLTESYKISVFSSEYGRVEHSSSSLTPGESVTLTLFPDYSEGTATVFANETDISSLINDNTLTYTPTTDTEFSVLFFVPENLDEYIKNSSFGSGDFTFWNFQDSTVIKTSDGNYAEIGTLSQNIDCPEGYYDISFVAKGEALKVSANGYEKEISLTPSWQDYKIRTYSDGEISLSLSGNASVDDFSLICNAVDENLLYFVDCGDIDPTTVNPSDKYGIYNSVTDQFYSEDIATGAYWGVVDTYTFSEAYPHLLTGAETWPYEYDLTDGEDKVVTYRYAKDQDDLTGNGITYRFDIPEDGDYAFEVGFYAPSHWMSSVNRKSSLTLNGTLLQSGIIPKSNKAHPIIVKKVASLQKGSADLNLKLDSDGAGGPMISYIKISKATPHLQNSLLNATEFAISGSATWNNDPSTQAKYAFDGDTKTFFDGISGGSLTLDLGYETVVSAIGFYPRENWNNRMQSTKFSASKDGINWDTLFVISDAPAYGEETVVSSNEFVTNGRYRYIKYENPYDYCNVAEINIYKEKDSFEFANLNSEICTVTSIFDNSDYYFITFTPESSGTFIQADVQNGILQNVKTSPLSSSVKKLSQSEAIYIWDRETLSPLVKIRR